MFMRYITLFLIFFLYFELTVSVHYDKTLIMNSILKGVKWTINFTVAKNDLLIPLVTKYKTVIECLKYHKDTISSK